MSRLERTIAVLSVGAAILLGGSFALGAAIGFDWGEYLLYGPIAGFAATGLVCLTLASIALLLVVLCGAIELIIRWIENGDG